MSLGRVGLRAIVLGGLVAVTVMALGADSAFAEPATTCVKATKVLTPKKHYTGGWTDKSCTETSATHEGKYEKLADFSESEETQLKALLKYMTVESSGVGGQPTVKLTGANLQVASGPSEAETNGKGNVVVGLDEEPFAQTGSNNLVVGGNAQEFTSYGGMVMGSHNNIKAPFATVTGGEHNTASETSASVSGGYENTASGETASVSGGEVNTASAVDSWIGGGLENDVFARSPTERGLAASIFGGKQNKTATNFAAIP